MIEKLITELKDTGSYTTEQLNDISIKMADLVVASQMDTQVTHDALEILKSGTHNHE